MNHKSISSRCPYREINAIMLQVRCAWSHEKCTAEICRYMLDLTCIDENAEIKAAGDLLVG